MSAFRTLKKRYFEFDYGDEIVRTPLPLPKNIDEYRKRFAEYENTKDDRNYEFLRKSKVGYQNAYKLYIDSVRQIYFILEGREVVNKKCFAFYDRDYTSAAHKLNLRRVFILLRKTAECCYFLDKFDEGLRLCDETIRVVENNSEILSVKPLKLTFCVISKIHLLKNEIAEALISVKLGFCLDNLSGIVQDTFHKVKKKCEENGYPPIREDEIRLFERFDVLSQENTWGRDIFHDSNDEDKNLFWKVVNRYRFETIPNYLSFKESKEAKKDLKNRIDYLVLDIYSGFVSDENNQKRFFFKVNFTHQNQISHVLKFLLFE